MKSARNETGSPTAGIETVRLMPAIGASLLSLLTTYGPVVLFLIVLVEEAGVPLLLPSDLMLLVVGSMVARGQLNFGLTVGSAVLATMMGTGILFTLAQRGGRPLLRRYGRWIHLDESRLERAEKWLKVHAFWRLTALRLVPGLRPYSTMTAGILGLPRRQATLAFALSGTIWASVWIGLGVVLGPHVTAVSRWLPLIEHTIGIGGLVLAALMILVLVIRSRIGPSRPVAKRRDQVQ